MGFPCARREPYHHAIVVGGSLSGMLAARVLSEHFAEVTVIERDALHDGPEPRKAVPHGRHAHGLLSRGWQVFASLFPGLEEELREAGATWMDMGAEFRQYHLGRFKTPFPSGVCAPFMSRPLLEWRVARRTMALPNVKVLAPCEVAELVATGDGGAIAGVKVRRDGAGDELLHAELVVDASGRGSRLPRWLKSLGYPAPEQCEVRMHVGYATRVYSRMGERGKRAPEWKGLFVLPRCPAKRGGMVIPIEGDRWMVTLIGWLYDHPAGDEKGFLDFARSLPVPDLFRTIESLAPLGDIAQYKVPSNQRRHYERLAHFPEGLAVMGDAICSLNPIYGQGITISALHALVLDACLEKQRRGGCLRGFSHALRDEMAKIVDIAWQGATREDMRYPEVEGTRPADMDFMHAYMDRVHATAIRDPDVARRILQVVHMLEPPSTLLSPDILTRVVAAEPR
ncbi:FAD-dependent monooxygenase [Pendulispora brunnea]|uniref:FAD-dependent monooxygenase n=1 Tax=Pendulispora brunnea TaxID=2905690 RepID=A0ABZ2KFK6_9BACT